MYPKGGSMIPGGTYAAPHPALLSPPLDGDFW